MDTLTTEAILSNLPTVLSLWSALVLSWGTYAMFAYGNMIRFATKCNRHCRPTDKSNVKFMIAANLLMAVYLICEPYLASTIADAIVVINVFYSAYLIPTSLTLVRWWKKQNKDKQSLVTQEDHLLT